MIKGLIVTALCLACSSAIANELFVSAKDDSFDCLVADNILEMSFQDNPHFRVGSEYRCETKATTITVFFKENISTESFNKVSKDLLNYFCAGITFTRVSKDINVPDSRKAFAEGFRIYTSDGAGNSFFEYRSFDRCMGL